MIIMFSEEVQFDLSPLAVISDPGRSSWFHQLDEDKMGEQLTMLGKASDNPFTGGK